MQNIPWVRRRTLLAGALLSSLTLSLALAFAANPLNPSPASRTQSTPRRTQPAATSPTPDTRSTAAKTTETARPQFDPALWSGMQWREIGPYRGGRALAIEGVPGEPNTYYFGAVAGGVWKTTDGGTNWKPIFDKQHTTSSIGALAVAPSDHNTIYAGSGEAALRGNITYGDGVYKSVDGGKHWRNVGLKDSRHIGALIVHPENRDIVFVAAVGHAFGPNEQRGIYR
ncbi:MAG TPA: hypothetical protein VGK72_06215, partial [Chthoniobacterales bacterium]